jgi:hypothetical protein
MPLVQTIRKKITSTRVQVCPKRANTEREREKLLKKNKSLDDSATYHFRLLHSFAWFGLLFVKLKSKKKERVY